MRSTHRVLLASISIIWLLLLQRSELQSALSRQLQWGIATVEQHRERVPAVGDILPDAQRLDGRRSAQFVLFLDLGPAESDPAYRRFIEASSQFHPSLKIVLGSSSDQKWSSARSSRGSVVLVDPTDTVRFALAGVLKPDALRLIIEKYSEVNSDPRKSVSTSLWNARLSAGSVKRVAADSTTAVSTHELLHRFSKVLVLEASTLPCDVKPTLTKTISTSAGRLAIILSPDLASAITIPPALADRVHAFTTVLPIATEQGYVTRRGFGHGAVLLDLENGRVTSVESLRL